MMSKNREHKWHAIDSEKQKKISNEDGPPKGDIDPKNLKPSKIDEWAPHSPQKEA